jgi:hypothetical protein
MANGQLGASDLAATTWTLVYEPPTGYFASTSINICNRNLGNAAVSLAIQQGSGASPAGNEYLEFEAVILGHAALERTGVVLNAGDKLVAYSDIANVSVIVSGFEGLY